ncbi:MAG: Rieske (2Fe-2S) protein [Solimonas sp.]
MTAIEVANSADVREGAVLAVKAGGKSLLLARVDGRLSALENRCPHLGLPLARGKVADGAIRCPFHGSRFDLCSGANLDWVSSLAGLPLPLWSRSLVAFGKQPTGLPTYAAQERDGKVYVDIQADI